MAQRGPAGGGASRAPHPLDPAAVLRLRGGLQDRQREPSRREKDALPTQGEGLPIERTQPLGCGHGYTLHVPYDDGLEQTPREPAGRSGAIDPGIVHAMACVAEGADGKLHTLVVSGRLALSLKRDRNKRVGQLARLQSRCQKWSKRWRKLQRAKAKVKSKVDRRLRDLDHKTSRQAADFFGAHDADVIYLGDVCGIEAHTRQKMRASRSTRQQLSQWGRGRQERYLAEKSGPRDLVRTDEAHTSQTCPACGTRRKVTGRSYRCRSCSFTWHRDGVGALNILSRGLHGAITPIACHPDGADRLTPITYRQPTRVIPRHTGGRDHSFSPGRGTLDGAGVVALDRASVVPLRHSTVLSWAEAGTTRRLPVAPAAERATALLLAAG